MSANPSPGDGSADIAGVRPHGGHGATLRISDRIVGMSGVPDRYLHGHHASVLRSHTWRTAENSAGYLLAHLRPGMSLLDVGCGPATITIDLARRLAPGRVVGIEPVEEPLTIASAAAEAAGVGNVSFELGDVYDLGFADDTFDVVHAHQVLQHLTDPVAALREMRRVSRPGGLVAVRDADYGAMTWFPPSDGLSRWQQVYRDTARAGGAEPDAGRHLKSWALAAGFDDVTCTADTWCFARPEDVSWWSDLWAERVVHSNLATQARAVGLATDADLADLAGAWRTWGAEPAAWFIVPNAELLATA